MFELKNSHCLTLNYKLTKTRTILLGKPQIPRILSILFLLPVCSRRGYQLPLPADDNHTFVILLPCCACLTLFVTSLVWLTCPYYMGLCGVYKTFTHLQLWSLIHKSCQVYRSLKKISVADSGREVEGESPYSTQKVIKISNFHSLIQKMMPFLNNYRNYLI